MIATLPRHSILALALILGLLSAAQAEPVQIQIKHDGQPMELNADWSVPTNTDPKQRGAILWVHGALQTYAMRDPVKTQAEKWNKAGFPVLSINLSNGISNRINKVDCTQPLDTTLQDAMREINAWSVWLQKKGIQKIVLAGHSLGGQEVILYAARHPAPILRGVLAVAPVPGPYGSSPQLAEAERRVAAGRGKSFLKSNFFACRDAEVSARTLDSFYGAKPNKDIRPAPKKISVPVLVVAGGQDEIVRDLPTRLQGMDGRTQIKVIDTADHFFRDFAADDLGDMASAFFRERLK